MKKSLLMLALKGVFSVRQPVEGSNRCWYCGELIHALDATHAANCSQRQAIKSTPKEK